ncbi:hypothetical protein K9L05_01600 [Candidatus Babeliales bacterium]|nr:hypothetical protein [Candidatus Babeliales bacterium]MCF7899326.1 hypothetical protein [Candidatus Babeliales bacterium]
MKAFKKIKLSLFFSFLTLVSIYPISFVDKINQINREFALRSANSQNINDRINLVTQALNDLNNYVEHNITTMQTICSKYNLEINFFRNLENALNFTILSNIGENIDLNYQDLFNSIERLNRNFHLKKARRQDLITLNNFMLRVEQSLQNLIIFQRVVTQNLENQYNMILQQLNSLRDLTARESENARIRVQQENQILQNQLRTNRILEAKIEILQQALARLRI